PQLFLPDVLGHPGTAGSPPRSAGDVRCAAVAGDELHRPGAGADLRRHVQRLVPRHAPAEFPADGPVHPDAVLPAGHRPVPVAGQGTAAPANPCDQTRRSRHMIKPSPRNVRALTTQRVMLAVLLSSPLLALSAAPRAGTAPIAETSSGTLEGSTEGPLHVFKGVPFAAPPVGELRWKAPAPVQAWEGVRDATRFGAACIQPTSRVQSIYAQDIGDASEDCLNLNIWAPADATNAPVFVWIHGGALRTGSSKEPFYDGARLAQRGVIV